MFLIFDTETTGLPRDWNAPLTDADNWPRCTQIAWQLHDMDGSCISHEDYLVRPNGYTIPYDAEKFMVFLPHWPKKRELPWRRYWRVFSGHCSNVNSSGGTT